MLPRHVLPRMCLDRSKLPLLGWEQEATKRLTGPVCMLMPGSSRTIPTVLAGHTEIRGHIQGHEDLVLEGTLSGQLSLEGHLSVTEGAHLDARAEVTSADVAGSVSGELVASSRIVVEKTAKITGTLRAPAVVIREGASLLGEVDMDVELPGDVGRGRLR